jgi:hypothetical protein
MYPYILCYCGRSSGDIYDLFKAMRDERIREKFGDHTLNPDILAISEDLQVDIGDIFPMLHITCDCCKARLVSQIEFKELY